MKQSVATMLLLATSLVFACSSEDEHSAGPPRYIIYSPNAEPLNGGALGRPTCEQALGNWFTQVSPSGLLSKAAFMADAQVQFARMDIDHNGYIVSEELERYRAPFRQTQQDDANQGEHKHRHGKSVKSDDKEQPMDIYEPVMSADLNLDFKVTLQEFLEQADSVFAKLDINHDGSLDRPEAIAFCKARD